MNRPDIIKETGKFFYVERLDVPSRNRCRNKECKKGWLTGAIRINKKFYVNSNKYNAKRGIIRRTYIANQWYHIDCIFTVFHKQRLTTQRISFIEDLNGWKNLSHHETRYIETKIRNCNQHFKSYLAKIMSKIRTKYKPNHRFKTRYVSKFTSNQTDVNNVNELTANDQTSMMTNFRDEQATSNIIDKSETTNLSMDESAISNFNSTNLNSGDISMSTISSNDNKSAITNPNREELMNTEMNSGVDSNVDQVVCRDHLFREFRRLVRALQEEDDHSSKIEILRNFFTYGSEGDGFKGDLEVWCKLLLPRDLYQASVHIQNERFLRIFSIIFECDFDVMKHDMVMRSTSVSDSLYGCFKGVNRLGDVADTIANFYMTCSRRIEGNINYESQLKMDDVDKLLEDLSRMKGQNEQISLFQHILKRTNSADLKYILRLIGDNLKLGITVQDVLDAIHPNASQWYAETKHNLRATLERCTHELNSNANMKRTLPEPSQVGPRKKQAIQVTVTSDISDVLEDDADESLTQTPHQLTEEMDESSVSPTYSTSTTDTSNSVDFTETSKVSPDIFENVTLVLDFGFPPKLAIKYLEVFKERGGDLCVDTKMAAYVLHTSHNLADIRASGDGGKNYKYRVDARHVIVEWITDSVERGCLLDFRPYTVRWTPGI